MKENESSKWLYNELVSNGYNVGKDYEEFDSLMTNNEESRKWAYDTARELGYNVGKDYEEFNTLVNPVVSGQPISIEPKNSTYSPYSVAPADYTQKTEAQKNYEERGDFEPKGQGTVNLNGQEVPVFIGDEGQFRVPSPVKLDEQQEIFRHGNPSEEEVREYKSKVESRENFVKTPQYAEGIGEGLKEGGKGLWAGVKHFAGEAANLVTGSSMDAASALQLWKEVEGAKGNINSSVEPMSELAARYHYNIAGYGPSGQVVLSAKTGKAPTAEEVAESKAIIANESAKEVIRNAIKKAGGDIDKAKKMLEEKAQAKTLGDEWIESAQEDFESMRPTKGVGAWIGNLLPQMAPTAAALALSVATKNPKWAKMVGNLGMGTMTAATAGQSMKEARDAGATNGQTWAVGITDGVIELITEKIPFDKYTKGVVVGFKKKTAQQLADAVATPKGANEMEKLLREANKKLGGKLFSGENAKDYMAMVAAEGLSEFSAEALQTMTSMIYEHPDEYPTITEVLGNGLEGAKAGIFMGSFLGAGSKIASHYGHDERRKQQGYINFAETKKGDVVEVLGVDKDNNMVVVDSKGEQQRLKQDEVGDVARVTYKEFKNAEIDKQKQKKRDEYQEVRDDLQAGESMTGEELQNANLELQRTGNELMRMTGMSVDELTNMSVDDVLALIDEANEQGNMELEDLWRSYKQASSFIQGNNMAVDNAINEQSAASDAEVDAITDGDGMIVLGTTRGGEQVYIIGGNVALNGDNSVNKEGSSAQLTVVRDGKRTTMGIVELESVDAPIDAAGEKVSRRTAIEENLRRQQRIDMGEEHVFTPGEKFETLQGEVQFVADRGDGTADITVNGNATVVDMGTLNEQFNTAKQMEYNARKAEETSQAQTVQAEVPQPVNDEQVTSEVAQSALQRVPKDEQGEPVYEQVDSDTAWDAIVEQTEGDEAMAQTVADGMVADKEAALKKLEKAKSKGGATIADKIAAEKERKAAIDAAQQEVNIWKKIAGTANRRKMDAEAERRRIADEAAALRKAEEERLRAEREEAERIEREALNGVPDMVDDTPQDARARGYRRVSGHKIDRQEPVQGLQGKEVAVRFSDDAIANGRVAVIDATQLQPSHIQGVRNPLHFIDEAQPKERNDEASVMSARKIAGNIRPEEITSSVTAYTGAPTVNARGEAIQGNNRSDALRLMWESHEDQAAQYKQYLIDHADEFGLNADDVAAMERPVLVNMLDVDDAEAITLGQFVAQDTESGGTERIKPKNALQKMGNDMRSFANLLLKSNDEDTSFAGLVDNNGVEVLKWMSQRGYITPTQYKSAFDSKGNLTAEAKNDLRGIMYQSIFKGGSTRLEEMFNAMPAKAQKAILATAFRDYDSPNAYRMIEEIQNSIRAFYALSQSEDFVNAKTFEDARLAVEGWKIQYQIDDVTGESYLPAENFSNFALLLATMYKGENQSVIQGTFNKLYDLIQGTQEPNLFEQPDNTPRSLAQAIYETLNITYDGQQRSNVLVGDSSASQRGQQGSTGDAATGERVENGERTADSAGSIEAESTTGGETVHQPQPERKGLEQTSDGGRETDGTGVADDATREVLGASNRGDIRVLEEGLDTSYREYSEYSERTRRTTESERLVSLAEAPVKAETTSTDAPYSIAPAKYTTKKGKVLDMHLVKFTGELTKEQQRAAKELAKADKGWYDREQGGFMMRSEESAKQLADTILGNEEAVSEAQPVSMTDIQALNNGDVLFTEPQQVEQTDSEEKSPVWQYSIHVDKETGRTTLRRDDVSGVYPIGDARWQHTAASPEEMLDILRNPLNGMQDVLEAVGVTLENKIKTRELDRKSKEQAPTAETNPSGNRLVTDERYAELRERMRKKLGGQMNIGIDPEILAIGTEMAVYHLEKGARKFTEFAKAMVADLGDVIRPYLKAFYNGARNLPDVESSDIATDMTSYDEVQTFDIANFDKPGIDAIATAETVTREAEVAQEVEVAQERIKKTRSAKNKSVNSQQEQLNLFDNGTEGENTRTGNSGTKLRPEELSDTQQVGSGTSVQDSASNSKGKRRNIRVGSSELGNRPKYDVNKGYTNEEIDELVSSVTDIVDGKVVITGEVTDDVKAICRQYKSGGVAKKGRGILDEYYTDGKIVDAVRMLITPYFNANNPVRVLEPSVGVGNFIEAARELQTSDVVAFEINETTARIAKVLYPNVDVNLRSFETEFIDDEGKKKPLPQKYNLVIGNPPYGSHRGLYKGLGEESKIARYEDYFVKRSLDVLEDGGVLAMVLPSSWIDRHTTFGGYTIEAAYRLPSGAFEATQVGTDIVVLKKDSSIPVSEHTPYFELHSDRILGEVKERKGRYGKMEEYVQGDIDVAIDAIEREHAKQIAEQLDIEATNDNLNDIQTAIEETGSADKAKTIVESEKKVTADKKPAPKASGKQGKYKVELNRGAETLPTSSQFTHEFSEGEVEAFEDTDYNGTINNPTKHRKYANFIGSKAVHDFYYAEGDIYSKLSQLEIDKHEIVEKYGIEQYEKQKRLLESVLPKRKDLDEITISPNTTFVKNLNVSSNGEAKSLKELFIDFCRKLPYGSFGDSSTWEVIGYVNNEQVHGTDKQRNQLIRERRKRVANDLFVKFLNDELSDEAKKQVVLAFNREYNSVYRPDYSRVPMFSTINKDFKGKPLKLTSVQLAGIGRMTVKGVGVLAHEVGFGKTLSGILAMHEAMTRGFAKKPLIVVPNDNILKQWVETIKEVLPSATVNMLGNLGTSYDLTDFEVNDGEFTIVTYEGLKAMSFSDDTYNQLADRFSYITEDLKKHQSERDIQKEIEKHNELKGKMRRGAKTSYGFEEFGFDWLTFDEVHNANHIVSKVRLDKSVASDFRSQSQRTSDLGLKTWLAAQYIQDLNNGRNVLLLSATPFTNKPLEYYSILSLVGNDMLKRKGFFNVDQFFATFMEADNDLEIGANGRPVQKTNVRRFRNNGLFQQLLSEFIDIKGEEDNPELVRPERSNKEYKIAQNDLTAEAMGMAQELLSDNDTVLQGIGHARAAAFSPYATSLLGAQPKNHREFVKNSPKIEATIKMIEQNKKDRPDAGQIIYSEVGVEYFPLIRDYLVKESGFKPNEVRIITGATSNNERVNIQSSFNDGEVKVVIGSPAIKEGLNLQGNTTDMYILSLPWNFTQLRQIEGRGWRQGNKWKNIRINYMLTNDSVDVFMLQRLQLKQGLYNEAMKSGAESLDVSDIDTSELKTALITDPAVRAEIVTVQEKAKLQQEKTQIEADLSFVMRKYEGYNKLIKKLNSQKTLIKQYKSWIKEDNDYWASRVKHEENILWRIENDIEQEKNNLLKKGVNVDDIVRQTEQSQEAIKGIQERIDNLHEYQDELTEKFRKEREAIETEQGDLLAAYLKQRKAENKSGFYMIRPTQSEQQQEDDTLYRSDDAIKNRIEALFNQAISGEFKGKPISIGRLTDEGKAYLEQISGVAFKEYVDFVLNPSDLVHIYKGHFGNNETDERSIPLDIEDIRNIADVISFPDRIIYAKENTGEKRKMFFFLKEAENGTYNLLEIYADKKGNLTAKTFYKTKEGVSQRAMTLSKSLHTTSETDGATLNDDAKIPQMFESASVEDDFSAREGDGAYTDDEVSFENDPISKVLGKPRFTRKQRREFAERERKRMRKAVDDVASALNTPIEVLESTEGLTGRRAKAKGWYEKSTGKIVVVLPNNRSVADVMQTVLHEAVAHHGLRKLFGSGFDNFIDNIYNNVDAETRQKINLLASRNGWNLKVATEEYLASLAEDANFERVNPSLWQRIKSFFLDMLAEAGVRLDIELSDNELRYILWRSYQNLKNPGRYRTIADEARDIAKQGELKVGNYADNGTADVNVAEESDAEYDRATKVAERFNARHKGAAPVVVMKNDKPIEEQLLEIGFSQKEIDFITAKYKKGANAFFNVERNIVVLLSSNLDNKQIKTILWHEAVHKVIREMGITHEQLNNFFELENEEEKVSAKEVLRNAGYEEELFTEEYLAYYIQELYWNGQMNSSDYNVLSRLNDKATENNRKQIEFVQPIINSIVNGTFGFHKQGDETGERRGTEQRSESRNNKFDGGRGTIDRLSLYNSAINEDTGAGIDDDVLFRSDSELAIENYNKRVLESGYQAQEALQDSMLALKEAQEAIVKETGKAIRDEENAYMAENALSSVNTAEAAEYKRAFYQPLVDEVATVGKKMGYEATYDYLMAKHGIERNREMSVKEALKVKGVVDKAKYESWKSERNDTIADAKNNGLSWEETQRKLDALAGNYGATIRDYSGLSSIYGDNFAEKAYSAVKDFENNVDTKALWARIKAANNATLMKLYNSSILDEETFAQISGMYEYYIPLRGFDEKTVEDVYAYVAQDTGRMGSVMKIARGRNSKAENPIAFIGQMAEQAITQGNRNRVKLKFLNFALSHMTSLLTVTRDVYLRREGEDWIVVTPKETIDKLNNPTPDQIAEAVQKWQEDMNEKVKESPKDFKKVDAREGIPYKMPNKDLLSEHQVIVKRAGKMFVITVNGSPRLAQALNGLTNPDQGTGIKLIDEKANAINKINRMLSNVYTTKNINFVASNFVRDIVYTNSMVWVKESPKYAMKFHKNCLKYNPAYMMRLFSKLENGTLDMSNEDEKLFMEFYKNGGETGYTQIKDIEAKKKELKKMLAKADRKGLSGIKSDPLGKGKDGFDAIGDFLDYVNRSVENVARFAAYKTSREMGRSVSKSIWDAKEISVNFNKKGAGGKFYKANGQTLLGSIAAAVSGTGRGTYVFWNASVQGMYNFAKNAKENPTKALGMAASVFALGVLVSMFAGDDDEYMQLPEYIRRSNICFKLPLMDKDSWVTISLSIEYRALYGAGEYLTNICTGKEEFDGLKAASLIAQLLPIDVLEGNAITEGDNIFEVLTPFAPSAIRPIWSVGTNRSWTGLPIWKDSPFDTENVPQYKRVYRNTSPALVSFTKMLNQFSGGDEYKTGWIDINPAKLEHVLEGYFGGYATMARQAINLGSDILGDEDYSFDPKDVPVASRVWKYADRERGSSGVKNKFYEYKNNHEVVKAQLKGYAKDAVDPKRTEEDRKYSAERVKEIQKSDAFKAMQVYEAFGKALDNARKMVKEDDTKENRRREAMLMEQVNREIEKVLNE